MFILISKWLQKLYILYSSMYKDKKRPKITGKFTQNDKNITLFYDNFITVLDLIVEPALKIFWSKSPFKYYYAKCRKK